MSSVGQNIIELIESGKICSVLSIKPPTLFVWAPDAAAQLDELVFRDPNIGYARAMLVVLTKVSSSNKAACEWHDAVAGSLQVLGRSRQEANQVAADFMSTFFGVDTSQINREIQ